MWCPAHVPGLFDPEERQDLVVEAFDGSPGEAMAAVAGVGEMRVVPARGDHIEAEREQWDDGNDRWLLSRALS